VVNDTTNDAKDLKVTAKVYDLDAKEKLSNDATIAVPALSSARAFKIGDPKVSSNAYFLRLTLEDASGARLSSNFYWLSTKPDLLAMDGYTWYYTPQKAYADFRELGRMAKVTLSYTSEFNPGANEDIEKVHVTNPTERLAFLIHLRLTRNSGGQEILPILWDDNYFELLPGESRDITAKFLPRDLKGAVPDLEVSGWNVSSAAAQ
jgi:exo-1,4-beta-D-glucosaminidase